MSTARNFKLTHYQAVLDLRIAYDKLRADLATARTSLAEAIGHGASDETMAYLIECVKLMRSEFVEASAELEKANERAASATMAKEVAQDSALSWQIKAHDALEWAEKLQSSRQELAGWLEDAKRDLAAANERADKAEALNVFFRDSVGECHVMISRNDPEYQIRKEWEAVDLPPRLQRIMRERAAAQDALREAVDLLNSYRGHEGGTEGACNCIDCRAAAFVAKHGGKQ